MFSEFFKNNFNDNTKANAFDYLVTNTLGKPKFGQDKLVELPGMDFESTFNKHMLPSMIYTFKYETKSKDTIGKVNFIDYVPVILCVTNEDKYITGINFNFLPNDVRAEFLDIIYNAYQEFYVNKLSSAVEKGIAILNEEFANFLIKEDTRQSFFKLMESKLKYPISSAYRKYNKTKIKNQRLIEFDMWKYIPCLVFVDAVRGAGLVEIQQEIIANK